MLATSNDAAIDAQRRPHNLDRIRPTIPGLPEMHLIGTHTDIYFHLAVSRSRERLGVHSHSESNQRNGTPDRIDQRQFLLGRNVRAFCACKVSAAITKSDAGAIHLNL